MINTLKQGVFKLVFLKHLSKIFISMGKHINVAAALV